MKESYVERPSAFRFTTDVLSKGRKREVSIAVGTVVAGVRGTDLWGRYTPERQVVCLIEGRIDIGAPGEARVTLDAPRQYYRREHGQTLPVTLTMTLVVAVSTLPLSSIARLMRATAPVVVGDHW